MFVDLMPLFPNEKGIVVLTVAKVSDTHLRVSVHPHADQPADQPRFSPVAFEGTPEELDARIDFSPLAQAETSIAEAIKAAAAKRTEEGVQKPEEPAKKGSPAPTPSPARTRSKAAPAATPVVPTPAVPTPAAAAPSPVAQAVPAETPAQPEPEPKPQPAPKPTPQQTKSRRDEEVAKLKAQLAALEAGGQPLNP
jgi:PRTRC genetic system protein E